MNNLSEEQQKKFLKVLKVIDKKFNHKYQRGNNFQDKMATSLSSIILISNYKDLKYYDNISIAILAKYLCNQSLYYLQQLNLPFSNELLKVVATKSEDYMFAQEYLILAEKFLAENKSQDFIIDFFENTSSEKVLNLSFAYMNKKISEIEKRFKL